MKRILIIIMLSCFVTGFSACKNSSMADVEFSVKESDKNLESSDLNKIGLEYYKAEEYKKAEAYFDFASGRNSGGLPFYLPAGYNLACTRTILYSAKEYSDFVAIIDLLKEVFENDSTGKWIGKAQKDKDFDFIRDKPEFADLLAYSLLKNSILHNDLKYLKENISLLKNTDYRDRYQNTLLLYAILEKNYAIIDFLIEKGYDINSCFANGNSPLFYLYFLKDAFHDKDDFKMVKYLIEKGADVNHYFRNGEYNYYDFYSYYTKFKNYSIKDLDESFLYYDYKTLLEIAILILDDKQYVEILFQNNINLNFNPAEFNWYGFFEIIDEDTKDRLHLESLLERRDYFLRLLRNHKDKNNAQKIIDYIVSLDVRSNKS